MTKIKVISLVLHGIAVLLVVLTSTSCNWTIQVTPTPGVGPTIRYADTVEPVQLEGLSLQTFAATEARVFTQSQALALAEKLAAYTGTAFEVEKALENSQDSILSIPGVEDPSSILDIDLRTSAFLLNTGLANYKSEQNTPDLAPEDEAVAVALNHLSALDILPTEDELVVAHVGGVSMAVHETDGSTTIYNKLITVRFTRQLANMPVLGASRIRVHLGENGKLVGLVWNWSEVSGRAVKANELRSDAEIQRELEARLRTAAQGATEVVMVKSDLVLYDDGLGSIEPMIHAEARLSYEIKIVTRTGEEEIQKYETPYDFYVPILKEQRVAYPPT